MRQRTHTRVKPSRLEEVAHNAESGQKGPCAYCQRCRIELAPPPAHACVNRATILSAKFFRTPSFMTCASQSPRRPQDNDG